MSIDELNQLIDIMNIRIEAYLKKRRYLQEEPPKLQERWVELGENSAALFLGEPHFELMVLTTGDLDHLPLPYFDPSPFTDEELSARLKRLIPFA